jgi:hypothetical protein
VGCRPGPAECLVDELERLVPDAGEQPRHDGPSDAVAFADLFTLRDLLRSDEEALLAQAVCDLGLPAVPGWVRDLASTTGGLTISVQHPAGDPHHITSAMATASGWMMLLGCADETVRGVPAPATVVRDSLLDAAVRAASASAA